MPDTKFYLTKKGIENIKKEYERLVEFKKSKTKGGVPTIWHSEDVNPEYLSFQEDLSIIDARLAEYENILKNSEVIVAPPKERWSAVQMGATVLCEVNGEKDEFTIVGSLEANPSLGKISNESPVGRALLGHAVGELVDVHSSVHVPYKILKISYK